MTVALEEKYDQVRQLIAMGKERGYLLYDEVNDILPPEVHSSEEIDDLLSTFERYGIDVYEDLSSAKAALAAADPSDSAEPAKEVEHAASLGRWRTGSDSGLPGKNQRSGAHVFARNGYGSAAHARR